MYEIFEHTADIGIRARAADVNQLFADAARGLFSVIVTNFEVVQPRQELSVSVKGSDIEEVLHDWLAELLYTFHGRRLVLVEFQVKIEQVAETAEIQLSAVARGEPIDFRRHEIDVEVKAITWHGLKIQKRGSEWTAEVIVDI
jgi:SHS2 domain-containing protein